MATRKALLAALLIGSAILAVVWMQLQTGRAHTSNTAPEPARAAEPEPPAVLVPAVAPREEATRSEAREPEVEVSTALEEGEEETEPGAARESGAAKAAPIELSGTIVVADEMGVPHPAEDGGFSFVLWSESMGTWHEVAVHGGRWSTSLPAEPAIESLGVDDVHLGGRPAVWDNGEAETLPLPENHRLDLFARWPIESLLHVRARESGRELAPVFVAEVEGWEDSEFGHPGAAAENALDLGPSPVRVPPSDAALSRDRTLYARSPGYGWGRISIDERRGGERFLELDPGGDLEVVLTGALSDAGTKLRLFGSTYLPAYEETVASLGAHLIEALPAGSYRVAVQIGDYWGETLGLGETTAEVVAGRRTSVTLALEAVSTYVDVPLAGTLLLPAEWELTSFELVFELLDPPLGGREPRFSVHRSSMESEGDPPSLYRWSTPDVQPGRYEAALEELGFSAVLEVGADGLPDARIEVPPPAEVRVRCVDAESGLDVEGVQVAWHCELPPGVSSWTHRPAKWDAELARWVCRTPIGGVVLVVSGDEYGWKYETVTVAAGVNDFVVQMSRPSGLKVILRDGQTDVPWDGELSPALTPTEGQEAVHATNFDGSSITLLVNQPGLYKVSIPEIPGYERVPDTLVRLEKGVVSEHVVELVRRP